MAVEKLQLCPLMSAGNDIQIVCVQEKCSWYLPNINKCSIYVMGYNTMLDVKSRIEKKQKK